MSNEQKVWAFFMERINNPYGVAGLMGNIYAESGFRPENLQNSYEKKLGMTDAEYTAAVDNGIYTNFVKDSAGYGLAQWTYHTRKQALLDFMNWMHLSIGDLTGQLEFLWKELQGYKGVLSTLKNAKSVKEASDVVLTQYERPADQSDKAKEKRAGFGMNIYKKYVEAGEKPQIGDGIMKKVFLGVGHGGSDPGAVKYLKEADVNLAMAQACRDYLQKNGVDVRMSRTVDEDDPLTEEIQECNAYGPDLAVDIHNNAGGGDGFEVFHSINAGLDKTLAENIEDEVKKIGQNSRGLKTRKNSAGKDYYGFIRSIKAPSIICEGVFVDNAADAAQADTLEEQRAFGEAYARGILKTLGVSAAGEEKPATQPEERAAAFVVQAGAYRKKEYAEDQRAKLAAAGFSATVEKVGAYHKVFAGAFADRGDAVAQAEKIRAAGFDVIINNADAAPTEKPREIQVGSKVRVNRGARTYTGGGLASFVYDRDHDVKEIDGDRVVITFTGIVVAAIRLSDLTLVE